jgi:hypothetical protein
MPIYHLGTDHLNLPEYILRDIFVRAVFLVLGNLSTTCKLIEMAMANSNGMYNNVSPLLPIKEYL